MPQPRFDGRVAVVTGGSNGIGRAITQAFVAEGAAVVVCDLVDSGLFDGEPRVETVIGDVAEAGVADRAIAAAAARWGGADILVNDAASYPDGTLFEMSAQEWDRVFRVNVTGAFMMIQAFARHCIGRAKAGHSEAGHSEGGAAHCEAGRGEGEAGHSEAGFGDAGRGAGRPAGGASVVSVSTGSAQSPRPGGAAYSASKSALETMSKVFAMELGPFGIRVNVVAPGYIDVRGWSDAFPDRASEELRAALVESIPLGHSGDPRDVADAVLFLASGQAANITGTVLHVDGGSIAGRYTLASARRAGLGSVRG